jgi:two-component system LytT family response regulator
MEAADPPYDVVLLDVRMPEVDGFEVLDRLPPDHRPAVVFTTAYDEYALRAFEASAVDYLLKPVSAERLDDALARVAARSGSDQVERLAELLERLDQPAPPAPAEPLRQFTIQARDRLLVVSVEHLVVAEVHDGITNLYVRAPDATGPSTRHIVSFTLDALEARLDPTRFMRVHRGALVRLTAIREMIPWFSGRYKLLLDDGRTVVASRARSRDLRERLSL